MSQTLECEVLTMGVLWIVFKFFSILALIDFCFLLVVAVCRTSGRKEEDDEKRV
jgi:energy-converting hydrogenase Eha subunit E